MELHAHDISIDDACNRLSIKESVYVNFDHVWRGQPVRVTMQASRYTYADGMLDDWRTYAEKSRTVKLDGTLGEETTDLARQRLGASLKTEMKSWLYSDAYTNSERRSYFYELRGKIRDARPYSDEPTKRERALIDFFAGKIGKQNVSRLLSICDAYDAFAKALDRGPWEPAKKDA
jgi:hypothetical protein